MRHCDGGMTACRGRGGTAARLRDEKERECQADERCGDDATHRPNPSGTDALTKRCALGGIGFMNEKELVQRGKPKESLTAARKSTPGFALAGGCAITVPPWNKP